MTILSFFVIENLHCGSFSIWEPPQRILFSLTIAALALLKTPTRGTSLSKLLNDRFKLFNDMKVSKYFGIRPENLLRDKSKYSIPLKELKDDGITPWT